MHVGVAKTGTTYLQRVLFSHREELKVAGLLYPGRQSGDQFVASVDLRALDHEKFDHLKTAGAWDRLAAEVRSFDGNAVISHETFARCAGVEVDRVLESFPDFDIQVVLTLRDLGRQIPAVWQETLKNKARNSYEEFLNDVFINTESGPHKFFWKPQNVSKVVKRWGGKVGMDNLTVVTVPGSGAPRDELWNRFSKAIALPDIPIELPQEAANSSLGPAEAELLRHLNASLPADFPWPRYTKVIKRQFAEGRLSSRSTTRIVVPPAWHQAVQERAASMVDDLVEAKVRVIGDLADLNPVLPISEVSGPDDLSRDELMGVAAEVVRDLVLAPPRRPADPLPAVVTAPTGRLHRWLTSVRGWLSRGS
jgi:hypothetical protein